MDLQKQKLEYIVNSYKLDGIEYPEVEVVKVLNGGNSILGEKEQLYIKNFSSAYDKWAELVLSKPYTQFTEEDFLNLHKIMLQNIDNDNAGQYRTVCAVFSGSRKLMPVPQKLPYIMGDIFYDIENYSGGDAISFAVDIHFRIIDAYPFVEKNKDMARFMFNLILYQAIGRIYIFTEKDSSIYQEIKEDTDLTVRKDILKNILIQ